MSDVARELRRERLACDPVALCQQLGIARPMKRQPRGVIICCPAHQEKDPSCSVRIAADETIAVKCHACGFSADAIGLVAQVHGLDFKEALHELARITGRWDVVDASRPRPLRRPEVRRPPPSPPPPAVSDERFHEIATAIVEMCPLHAQADVVGYLESRGLVSEAGMAGLAALPPPAQQKALHDALEERFDRDIELAGLARNGALMFASNRLIIPWRDRSGRVETLQRRRIDDVETCRYVFPRGRQMRSPFGVDLLDGALERLGTDAEIIISEGALDALARRRLARMDDRRAHVVAVPSASTLLEQSVGEIVAGRVVVLSLDNDEAGDRAATRLYQAIRWRARSVRRERPVNAKDMGEVLQRRLQA